jgi:hypothetical protein
LVPVLRPVTVLNACDIEENPLPEREVQEPVPMAGTLAFKEAVAEQRI